MEAKVPYGIRIAGNTLLEGACI